MIFLASSYTKVDKIAGVVCLILSGICSIYPIRTFFIYSQEVVDQTVVHGVWQVGKGAGAGAVCAIVFLIIGVWLLLQTRKKGD